jgi:hypothetical protein
MKDSDQYISWAKIWGSSDTLDLHGRHHDDVIPNLPP